EIVGREFEAPATGGFDKSEILIGQPENGDFQQIDLLAAGKRQQQIDRPFISVQREDQCLIAGRRRRLKHAYLRKVFFCHAVPISAARCASALWISSSAG